MFGQVSDIVWSSFMWVQVTVHPEVRTGRGRASASRSQVAAGAVGGAVVEGNVRSHTNANH